MRLRELLITSSPVREDFGVVGIALDCLRVVLDGSGVVAFLEQGVPLVLLFECDLRVNVFLTCAFCKTEKLILNIASDHERSQVRLTARKFRDLHPAPTP